MFLKLNLSDLGNDLRMAEYKQSFRALPLLSLLPDNAKFFADT